MTAVDVDALDRLREAATAGPWRVRDDGVTVEIEGVDRESVRDRDGFRDPDAALIVAAVNALPDLLAEVRRGRALREAVAEIVRWMETAPSVTVEIEAPRRLRAALRASNGEGT